MKALFVALLFGSLNSFSQGLGWDYKTSLDAIKNKPECTKYEEYYDAKNEFYSIYMFYKADDPRKLSTFFFNKNKECYLIKLAYSISDINKVVEINNRDFVRISEYKWKDYQNDFFITLEKLDEWCVIIINQ